METTRNKIGFNFYEVEALIETPNPIENITVQEKEVESSDVVIISPAHKEVLNRIALAEFAIKGEKFTTFTDVQKQELLDELVWLTEINAQLTFSY
jgi:hypothetical protein